MNKCFPWMDGVILSWMDVNSGKMVSGKFLGSFRVLSGGKMLCTMYL
jgi:hypothetical protein